ncbi:MAG: sugar transferase, partial [Anaerolineales bacterium]|nr:sugar transferase [Anaerolineales bacterium]
DLIRRNIDSVTAFLLLIWSLPVTVLLALLLKLTAGNTFRAVSVVGLRPLAIGPLANVETFELLRFNTRREDGSVTQIGRLLERFELNRLPELWNVFRGDMCLVGVKPITPDEAAHVTEAWQEQRYSYPAGFTGLWYVQSTPQRSRDDSLIADTYYTATRSWREDVRLVWQSVGVWLRRLLTMGVNYESRNTF